MNSASRLFAFTALILSSSVASAQVVLFSTSFDDYSRSSSVITVNDYVMGDTDVLD